MPPPSVTLHALRNIPEVRLGDDLARLLADAIRAESLVSESGDILVVTSKVVSKAERRMVPLGEIVPSKRARELALVTRKDARLVELVLRESSEIVRIAPHVLITRHLSGLVMANAGIDQSNIGPDGGEHVLLLPADPDGSAERLHGALANLLDVAPAVLLSDSFGRPWRLGVANVGIGAAGFPALWDRRGESDRDGRTLQVTQIALADMVASAAGLVMGEGNEGIPAVLVRGLVWSGAVTPASSIIRPRDQDLFA